MVWEDGAGGEVMGQKTEGGSKGWQDEARGGRGDGQRAAGWAILGRDVRTMRRRSTYTITNTSKEIKN